MHLPVVCAHPSKSITNGMHKKMHHSRFACVKYIYEFQGTHSSRGAMVMVQRRRGCYHPFGQQLLLPAGTLRRDALYTLPQDCRVCVMLWRPRANRRVLEQGFCRARDRYNTRGSRRFKARRESEAESRCARRK